MPAIVSRNRTERINIRVTKAQAQLIRLAASQKSANVSTFLVESACLRAEEELASQRHFVYTEKQWTCFTAALDSSAKLKPRLRELLAAPSALEQRPQR